MFVTRISISRESYYGAYSGGPADPSKPFVATIEVHGSHGKVELKLSPAMSADIVAIISEEVAAAGRATAEAMVATCLNALPAPEKQAAQSVNPGPPTVGTCRGSPVL